MSQRTCQLSTSLRTYITGLSKFGRQEVLRHCATITKPSSGSRGRGLILSSKITRITRITRHSRDISPYHSTFSFSRYFITPQSQQSQLSRHQTPRIPTSPSLTLPGPLARTLSTTTTTTTATVTTTANTMADIVSVDKILSGKYPAKAHAQRVAEYIQSKASDSTAASNGIIYLEGRTDALLEDSDEPVPFRQRRAFFYLTGVDAADCALVYDIASQKSTLFIPPVDPESVVWSGLPLSAEEALEKYDVDAVLPTSELNPVLARLGGGGEGEGKAKEKGRTVVYAIAERVGDAVTFLEFAAKDFKLLAEAIDECRVVKDEYEVALIRKANIISGAAHRAVLENVKGAKNEFELEGVFIGECIRRGAKKQAYPSIVAGGRAAATLHYVHNDKDLGGKDLLLLDAGAEWTNYAADITRTFPITGKFTTRSRAIYDIVLQMQTETIAALKEGVAWDDVHLLAHKVAIDGLLKLGILKGGSRDEILAARTSAAFLPHGLGHYLGLDTHDTGGHPNYADPDPLFRYLRVRRNLPAGSVITVEPGIYFCEFIVRPYLKDPKHAQFIDEKVLDQYWDVGGVRIEDNLLITKDGSVNLTDAVKDPDELEKIISGAS